MKQNVSMNKLFQVSVSLSVSLSFGNNLEFEQFQLEILYMMFSVHKSVNASKKQKGQAFDLYIF